MLEFATDIQNMKAFKPNVDANADNAIVWQDGRLYLLDQRELPHKTEYIGFDTPDLVAEAISLMIVRGAPAIGITAAYGVVLGAQLQYKINPDTWRTQIKKDLKRLAKARPTAVNLAWALNRMKQRISKLADGNPVSALLKEAKLIHKEDRKANKTMGKFGASLIKEQTSVITHCNAGALATGGYGTALGVIRSAVAAGKIKRVFADETRPWLQGTRLTAWELEQDGIPVTLITDGAAAYRMACGGIGWIIVGSDRIAANGDVANKIGTYGLAVAARYHGVKFMVAAPTSTIDMSLETGKDIPIEKRHASELLTWQGVSVSSGKNKVWNPVFDITPAALVDAIVTEKGIVKRPNKKKMRKLMSS